MTTFATEICSTLMGNPHSESTSSQLSTSRIEDIRHRVLSMFNADPAHFDVVFVANSTAGIKLVAEAFRAAPDGFDYVYHQASHTSLIGVRQEAQNSICVDDAATIDLLNSHDPIKVKSRRPTLFAYPAQSNLDGRRFPLQWCHFLRMQYAAQNSIGDSKTHYSLLDAAAYVPTAPLNLSDSDSTPDFTVLSFYKIFGFPDLGGFIVRRQSAPILLKRRYFGGGTVGSVVCEPEQWHALKDQNVHEALEDGTLPIHSIMALDIAMSTHLRLFGTIHEIARHTSYLTNLLRHRLQALRHGNGTPICVLYSSESEHHCELGSGATIAFNMQDVNESWVSLSEFQKLASLKGFHLRTGGICNPGGISAALGLASWEIKRNHARGIRCGTENDIVDGKPTGVIRLSLGAMSTKSDIDKFTNFLREFYCSNSIAVGHPSVQSNQSILGGFIEDIIVYPIKSCGGFHVPNNVPWHVRAEGLMWDREWCLIHRATGRALSQKRYPRMALLQPTIDLETHTLKVSFSGNLPPSVPASLSIPLSRNIESGYYDGSLEWTRSRVCEDDILIQRYISPVVNDFFSKILGVPCSLARFLPGNSGRSLQLGKIPQVQSHTSQKQRKYNVVGSVPNLLSTKERSQRVKDDYKILLSNESPILAVTTASIRTLNNTIESNGASPFLPRLSVPISSLVHIAQYRHILRIPGLAYTSAS